MSGSPMTVLSAVSPNSVDNSNNSSGSMMNGCTNNPYEMALVEALGLLHQRTQHRTTTTAPPNTDDDTAADVRVVSCWADKEREWKERKTRLRAYADRLGHHLQTPLVVGDVLTLTASEEQQRPQDADPVSDARHGSGDEPSPLRPRPPVMATTEQPTSLLPPPLTILPSPTVAHVERGLVEVLVAIVHRGKEGGANGGNSHGIERALSLLLDGVESDEEETAVTDVVRTHTQGEEQQESGDLVPPPGGVDDHDNDNSAQSDVDGGNSVSGSETTNSNEFRPTTLVVSEDEEEDSYLQDKKAEHKNSAVKHENIHDEMEEKHQKQHQHQQERHYENRTQELEDKSLFEDEGDDNQRQIANINNNNTSEKKSGTRAVVPFENQPDYLNYTMSHDGMIGVEAIHGTSSPGDDDDVPALRPLPPPPPPPPQPMTTSNRVDAFVANGINAAASIDEFCSSPEVADRVNEMVSTGGDAALMSKIHATVSRTLSSVFSATEQSVESVLESGNNNNNTSKKEDAVGAENRKLIEKLYSHLLPYGILAPLQPPSSSATNNHSNNNNNGRPPTESSAHDHPTDDNIWTDTEEEEDPGYTVLPLTKTHLLQLEMDFQKMVSARLEDTEGNMLQEESKSGERQFEHDLKTAEDLLEREEKRAKAVAESVALGGKLEDVGGNGAVPVSSLPPAMLQGMIDPNNDNNNKDNRTSSNDNDQAELSEDGDNGGEEEEDAEDYLDNDDRIDEAEDETMAGHPHHTKNDQSSSEDNNLCGLEHVKKIGFGKEGELEQFSLPIVYSAFQTGFEPTKDMILEPGMIVAGQYLVESELGSAAFSTAYRCVDMAANPDDYYCEVCLKVIKNTKDFFDQSLDEIKVLELLRQTGECEEHNIVEMRSFFYFKEHLIIVTELLRQNLFEFGKFIVENDEVPYFSMTRLCYITRQILVGLDYIHSLGLIHSDIKPENILIASYSRARVKIIDFGSSCFFTDRQSSYIQSRSYRAPEVIMGLPYDGKIDIWSLGCVVAEMFTGQVTFQNRSVVSMLSRIEAICGPFPRHLIANGKHSSKFFTPNGLIYEGLSKEKVETESHDEEDDTYESSAVDRISQDEDIGLREAEGLSEEWFQVYRPKRTTLSERLGFDADLMERSRDTLEDEEKALFTDFVRSLLTIDPGCRPTAAEALRHPWILPSANLTEKDVKYTPDDS